MMGESLTGTDGSGRQPSLSVFFPCYDDAPTIGAQVDCVDAVLDRLGIDGEIIVVNDGATAGTARRCSPDSGPPRESGSFTPTVTANTILPSWSGSARWRATTSTWSRG